MNKIDWIRKLTSRKLWLAVAGFVSGCIMAFGGTESRAAEIGGLILQGASVLSYILAEGWRDAAEAQLPEGFTVNVKKEEMEP
jgi:hypothetical protein